MVHRSRLAAAVAILSFAAMPCGDVSAQAMSAHQVYSKALDAMSDLRQPTYLSYRVDGAANGLQIDFLVLGGQLWLNIHGGSTSSRWSLRHRTYDYTSDVVNQSDGKRYLTARSFFDPTWYGAIRALREGILYSQDPSAPRSTSTPPPLDPTIKTIAAVTVMGPGIYRIEDRGSAACPNGAPGRMLHLVSRSRDPQHQLSDVIVDMQSMRFCMMRFSLRSAFGFHGIMEEYYGNVGGYWMQTGGLVDGTIRAFGISMHHGTWRYRISDVQFPSSLPTETFAEAGPPQALSHP